MKVRKPIVAGAFYPFEKEKLKKQIENCFLSEIGPGKISEKDSKKYFAAIVPHAGYSYSGFAAAHVYKKIAKIDKPDIFILIGNNHSGLGGSVSISNSDAWQTPLGIVNIDKEFSNEIIKNSKFANFDETAHIREHSIEVQLPFLQFLFNDFNVVSIVLKKNEDVLEKAKDLADSIKKSAENLNKKIFVIASSDFTHYGHSYDFTPFYGTNQEIKNKIYELDKKAINKIVNLKAKEFLNYVNQNNLTICGCAPILSTIFFSKHFTKKGKLLKYYTSGEISRDYNNCVGYAGIIF